MSDFPTRTVTLSFKVSASCESDLPSADEVRRLIAEQLPSISWLEVGDGWRIEKINVGPQP